VRVGFVRVGFALGLIAVLVFSLGGGARPSSSWYRLLLLAVAACLVSLATLVVYRTSTRRRGGAGGGVAGRTPTAGLKKEDSFEFSCPICLEEFSVAAMVKVRRCGGVGCRVSGCRVSGAGCQVARGKVRWCEALNLMCRCARVTGA